MSYYFVYDIKVFIDVYTLATQVRTGNRNNRIYVCVDTDKRHANL